MTDRYINVPRVQMVDVLDVGLGVYTPNRILVPTNGVVRKDGAAVMGRGVASQVKVKFPGCDAVLGALIRQYGSKVQQFHNYVYAFPTKDNWRDPSSLELIRRSARELVELVKADCKEGRWYLPVPGWGNGGLRLADILTVLLEEFDNPEIGRRIVLIEKEYDRTSAVNSAIGSLRAGESPQEQQQMWDPPVQVIVDDDPSLLDEIPF